MRGSFKIASALAGTLLASPALAQQDADHWYLSAGGSVSLLDDAHMDVTGLPTPVGHVETEHPFKTGYGFQAAVGRKIGSFRVEAEAGYGSNHADHYVAIVPPTGRIPQDGDQNAIRLMANAYVDFGKGRVQPFVGGGIGWTRVQIKFTAPRAPFPSEAPRSIVDTHVSAFAWQAMAGVSVRLNDRFSLTAQYRRHSAGDLEGRDLSDFAMKRGHAANAIDLGVRVRL